MKNFKEFINEENSSQHSETKDFFKNELAYEKAVGEVFQQKYDLDPNKYNLDFTLEFEDIDGNRGSHDVDNIITEIGIGYAITLLLSNNDVNISQEVLPDMIKGYKELSILMEKIYKAKLDIGGEVLFEPLKEKNEDLTKFHVTLFMKIEDFYNLSFVKSIKTIDKYNL